MSFRAWGACLIVVLFALFPPAARGYSVLAHAALIDAVWETEIAPMLRKRFPGLTAEELRRAHAHAYGGSLIQDMGYYPAGNKLFTDLAHYTRAGDFIEALLAEARDANEYAFALGALSHYADNIGHAVATNRAVPMLYPKLGAKFGGLVTFAQSKSTHLKTEFGFDVLQVARGRYAPDAYREFIGFEVAEGPLQRAFRRTYGLEMTELFPALDVALGSYRRAVSRLVPQATRVAWQLKKSEIEKVAPGTTRQRFLYLLRRADYEKQWGTKYKEPGMRSKVLAFLISIIPKIGPLRILGFRPPTPETERMFLTSFEQSVARYAELLKQAAAGWLRVENRNFDTGKPIVAGDYRLADLAYAELLRRHAAAGFQNMTAELRADILAFYAAAERPAIAKIMAKNDPKEWAKTLSALEGLRQWRAVKPAIPGAPAQPGPAR